MKRTLILAAILAASPSMFAQDSGNAVFYRSAGQAAGPVTSVSIGAFGKGSAAPVQGAPYSASVTNESVQILSDGTQIAQTGTGNVARDSEGRTRQDTALPAIGNLSATDAPHLVFIQDPVARTAYTLNLTDKTAEKIPSAPPDVSIMGPAGAGEKFLMHLDGAGPAGVPPDMGMVMQKAFVAGDQGNVSTEDLGTHTMEGLQVTGVRTTRTIPAGEIGNNRPISIVTEVWISPELKTVVYSKRTDPRMGEQTFQLKNIVLAAPDPSLFTVPPDFKIVDGPRKVIYRSN